MRVLVNHVAGQVDLGDLARADREIQRIRTRLCRLERRRAVSRWFQRTFTLSPRRFPAPVN